MSRTKQAARRAKAKRVDETISGSGEDHAAKKIKAVAVPSVDAGQDASTSNDENSASALGVISRLLGGMSFDEFLRDYFEIKPLLVRAKDTGKLFSPGLFSREALLRTVATNSLDFGEDMTMCRYVNNERDNFVPSNGKLNASKKQVGALLEEGYSCQLYQPQRYVDGLCSINAAFEEIFGCLAGASAYLTPPSAQALAPHHDDVEVFILQTQGRKEWKLHKPLVELAGEHSSDLSPERIGDVWQEFTLEEGDMLYFPRGVIHQASTDSKEFSTHVTISVYQHNSWANFLEVSLPRVIRRAFDSDVAFRRGLPVGYLNYVGTQFPMESAEAQKFATECEALVHKLGQWVDPADLQQAADEASLDYFANRLPPTAVAPTATAEFILKGDVKVRLRDRSHVRLVLSEDPSTNDTVVSLFHSARNCRIHHMRACSCILSSDDEENDENEGSGDDQNSGDSSGSDDEEYAGNMDLVGSAQPHSLTFSGSLARPMMKLYSTYPVEVPVQVLVDLGEDETEVRGMLLRLWSEGLLFA